MCQVRVFHKWVRWKSLFLNIRVGIRVRGLHLVFFFFLRIFLPPTSPNPDLDHWISSSAPSPPHLLGPLTNLHQRWWITSTCFSSGLLCSESVSLFLGILGLRSIFTSTSPFLTETGDSNFHQVSWSQSAQAPDTNGVKRFGHILLYGTTNHGPLAPKKLCWPVIVYETCPEPKMLKLMPFLSFFGPEIMYQQNLAICSRVVKHQLLGIDLLPNTSVFFQLAYKFNSAKRQALVWSIWWSLSISQALPWTNQMCFLPGVPTLNSFSWSVHFTARSSGSGGCSKSQVLQSKLRDRRYVLFHVVSVYKPNNLCMVY